MRHGRLLAESEPGALLRLHDLPSLEDVFLKLCVKNSQEEKEKEREKEREGSQYGTLTKSLGGTLTRFRSSTSASSSSSSSTSDQFGTAGRKPRAGNLVYPGITAMAEDLSIQPISYAKREESELDKIKRRLSIKKRPSSEADCSVEAAQQGRAERQKGVSGTNLKHS